MNATRCQVCGETLRDPESISRGIGPICAGRLTKFLAAVGSSAEEVAALALIDDSAVARWLRVAARAVGAGQTEQARRFLNAAREAAKVARAEQVKEAAQQKAA